MKCKLCNRPSEGTYSVDPEKEIPLCWTCFGRWSPKKLDGLLGVKQADYGIEGKVETA